MRKKQLLSFALVIFMICYGCKKETETEESAIPKDIATAVAGVYEGTWHLGYSAISGSVELVRVSNTKAHLSFDVSGAHYGWGDATLREEANNKISLLYKESNQTVTGIIINDSITVNTIDTDGGETSFKGIKK
jgi:hypothetical protein